MTYSESATSRTGSGRRSGFRFIAILLFAMLIAAVLWLFFEVGRIRIPSMLWKTTTLSSRVDGLESDVEALDSDLDYVSSVAANANLYAHSHYSDLRLKRDIAPLSGALEKVLTLQGVSFEWNREQYPALRLGRQREIGLIAQDVEQLYPELVFTSPDGLKSVDYAKLTPILIEAIRVQQVSIERLERENDDLDARLSALEGGSSDHGAE
jgi:outer membrane murein-binding lipoprotein Lpp